MREGLALYGTRGSGWVARARLLVLRMVASRGPIELEKPRILIASNGWLCRACGVAGCWRGDLDASPVLLGAFLRRHQHAELP